MGKARKAVTYIVILYVSISVANQALDFFQRFPVNIWINRLICIAIAALVGGVLGDCLLTKNTDKKFDNV